MSTFAQRFSAFIFLLFVPFVVFGQNHFRSKAAGNWNAALTWEISTNGGSTWSNTSSTPTDTNGTITILNAVQVTADVTADQILVSGSGQLIVDFGVALSIADGPATDLTVENAVINSGTITMTGGATMSLAAGASYTHSSASSPNGILAAATIDPTSFWIYAGSSTLSPSVAISGASYGYLSLSSVSGTMNVSVSSGSGSLNVVQSLLIGDGTSVNLDLTGYTGAINANNLEISPGSTLTIGLSTITVANYWYNGGTFNAGTGTVALNNDGSGFDIYLEHPGTGAFNNLEVVSANDADLGSNITVNGSLILTSGLLRLGPRNLTLGASASIGGTPDATSMIVTDGLGQLRKVFTGTGSFTFPVGENTGITRYSPITLNFSGGTFSSAYAGVRVIDAKHPNNTSTTNFLDRYWTVTSSGISGFLCSVTCTYVQPDVNGTESNIYGGLWNGSSWDGLDQVNSELNRFSGTVSSFGDFTGAELAILPVQLASFTVKTSHQDAELRWSTATETNNYGFEIERRPSGSQAWSKVSFVAGSGTSTSPHEYSYADRNLAPGRYAYRLKQVDNDGSFSYSGSAEVEIGLAAKEFKLESNYPNPFNPSTTIQFTLAEDGKASLKVFNMLGQEVATLFDGEALAGRIQQVKFDASRLPSGLYFAKLEAGKRQMMRKMMLVK